MNMSEKKRIKELIKMHNTLIEMISRKNKASADEQEYFNKCKEALCMGKELGNREAVLQQIKLDIASIVIMESP